MTKGSEPSGLAAIVLATMMFSTGAIIIKSVDVAPAAIVFWRLVIGITILCGVAWAMRAPFPKHWRNLIATGAIFGVHQLCFFAATRMTSIAIVTLIGALQPLLVSFVSRQTVGEPVPPGLRLWAFVAVAGVGVVVHANWYDASRALPGDLLAIANLVLFTAYFLLAKRARQAGEPTLTWTIGIFIVGLLVVGPVFLLSQASALAGNAVPVTRFDLLLLVILALVPGNGHLLVNWAHSRVSAALSSLILTGMPLLASIWAHLVFGEPYGWRHVIGMLLVVAAVEGGRRAEHRRARDLVVAVADEPSL